MKYLVIRAVISRDIRATGSSIAASTVRFRYLVMNSSGVSMALLSLHLNRTHDSSRLRCEAYTVLGRVGDAPQLQRGPLPFRPLFNDAGYTGRNFRDRDVYSRDLAGIRGIFVGFDRND